MFSIRVHVQYTSKKKLPVNSLLKKTGPEQECPFTWNGCTVPQIFENQYCLFILFPDYEELKEA